MTLLQHILAKDFRRLRRPLLAWLLIVAGRVAITAARPEFAFDDLDRQFALDSVSELLTLVDLLTLALLVSWLVHDEPLVGADAFWLTRPIRPMTLMAAKLMFAALLLIGAPVLAQSIVVAVAVRSPSHAIRLIPGLLSAQSLWVAALFAIAALTASLTRFLLALAAATAAAAIGISALMAFLIMTMEETSYPNPDLADPTAANVASWLLLAVALIVIGLQYRTRQTRLACSAGVVGVVLSVFIAGVWLGRFAGPREPDPGVWARDLVSVAAVLDSGGPYVTDDVWSRRRRFRKKQIAAPIRLTGVPPQYAIQSLGVRSRLELAGGSTIQSAQGEKVAVPREAADRSLPDYLAPVQAVLLPSRLVGQWEEPRTAQWPVVLTLTADEYERHRRSPGTLTATLEAFLQESRLLGSIPLAEGAALHAPSVRLELRRVLRRPGDCSLLIREIGAGTGRSGGRRSYRFFLRNVQRGEAVIGDSDTMVREGPTLRGLFFAASSVHVASESGFGFLDRVEHYPARSPVNPTGPLDAEWLGAAELVVIETAYAGRFSRSIVVEDFRMER
jgi:hypothetical protein